MHDAVDTLHSVVECVFLLDIRHDDERELASVVVVQTDQIISLVKSNANILYARERKKIYTEYAVRDNNSLVVNEYLVASISPPIGSTTDL